MVEQPRNYEEIKKSEEERIKNLSPEYIDKANKERARVDRLSDYELLNEVISESEKKFRNAEEMALTDELTGIRNRRALETIGPELMNVIRRNNGKFSILMFDIDKFKEINDSLGHQAGDEILKGLPREIGENIRRSDFMARYGGDEFTLLLPGTDAESALLLAEKIRMAIEDKKGLGYTISIGVFGSEQLPEKKWTNYYDFNSLSVLKEMIDKADKALYKAKEEGRNRTILFQESIKNNYE